ncbi:MAG: hypothetical protein QM754_08440 [Tepidisphaeraceae bacterium]
MQTTLTTPRVSASRRVADQPTHLDPEQWQAILGHVRQHHPSMNRVWFDQLVAHELSNGMIQVKTQTLPQLNFMQMQGQQPFTAAAQAVTGRLVSVLFHCDHVQRGGVFAEGQRPSP